MVLGHLHPGCRGHYGRGGRDVERAGGVAPGSGRIQQGAARLDGERGLAHHPRQARQLVGRLALHPQGDREGADLSGRGIARDDVLHRLGGFLFAEIDAVDQLDQCLTDSHVSSELSC